MYYHVQITYTVMLASAASVFGVYVQLYERADGWNMDVFTDTCLGDGWKFPDEITTQMNRK
jgi:hypothetical protein